MMLKNRELNPWCLSHLPGHGCFISHHCSNSASKQVLIKSYQVDKLSTLSIEDINRNNNENDGKESDGKHKNNAGHTTVGKTISG